jgi:hypothetical protein
MILGPMDVNAGFDVVKHSEPKTQLVDFCGCFPGWWFGT